MLRQLANMHTIYLVVTENPVNSSLTSTLYKTHQRPVITPSSAQILKFPLFFLLATLDVSC